MGSGIVKTSVTFRVLHCAGSGAGTFAKAGKGSTKEAENRPRLPEEEKGSRSIKKVATVGGPVGSPSGRWK